MLVISHHNMDVLEDEKFMEDCEEIKSIITHLNPSNHNKCSLKNSIKEIALWAIDHGMKGKDDISILCELIINQNLHVIEDTDLHKILQSSPLPSTNIMLRYLAQKPPDFWGA